VLWSNIVKAIYEGVVCNGSFEDGLGTEAWTFEQIIRIPRYVTFPGAVLDNSSCRSYLRDFHGG
jgi:hypothetical protein